MGAPTAVAVVTVSARRGLAQHRGQTPERQSGTSTRVNLLGESTRYPLPRAPSSDTVSDIEITQWQHPVKTSAGAAPYSGAFVIFCGQNGQIARETPADARG